MKFRLLFKDRYQLKIYKAKSVEKSYKIFPAVRNQNKTINTFKFITFKLYVQNI